MSAAFSTSEVAPAKRLAYWREMVFDAFVPLEMRPLASSPNAREFTGSASSREIGSLRVARVTASPMRAIRSARHIDAAQDDDYFVALHLRGTACATQDGRHAILQAGDLALLDSTRPYAIEFQHSRAFEHLIFRVRRSELDGRCRQLQRATAMHVPLTGGEGSVTAPYLRRLAALDSVTSSESTERLVSTGLDLLSTAIAAAAGLTADPEPRERARLNELKRCARAHLGDPGLTPATVARARFVSVRQLHRLFALEQTTFGAFVRDERLRRCARDLSDPQLERLPIAQIAARWGYGSPAHFTRAFTAHFGVGPRDFRRSTVIRPAGGETAAGFS